MIGYLIILKFPQGAKAMEKVIIAKIAVSAATFSVDKPYDYLIPDKYREICEVGTRVTVPFGRGNRRSEGVILAVTDVGNRRSLKSIDTVLDKAPVISEENVKLAMWMSGRFFCTVFEALRAMVPAGLWFNEDDSAKIKDKVVKIAELIIPCEEAAVIAGQKKIKAPKQSAVLELLSTVPSLAVSEICELTGATRAAVAALEKQGLLTLREHEVFRRPTVPRGQTQESFSLNAEQLSVYDAVCGMLDRGKAEVAMLFGITGSGKTSVYVKVIERAISMGKTAIVLVPEIVLTPQFISLFTSYFKDSVAVLHSRLGMGERRDEWKRIKNTDVKIVIGTRSAVFAPLENLGVIVIDEEQEHTFKSENNPRYHARDIAKYRCSRSGAVLILGSATPSTESMYNAQTEKYTLLKIAGRYNEKELPPVIIADMKNELKNGNGSSISSVLENELKKNIESGQQSILFINRRGANTLITCVECGYTYTCPRCSVSMTYHSANSRLMCHYCGYSASAADACPDCGGKLKYIGAGTQKVETELAEMFPGTHILRMDADTVSRTNSHELLLSRFRDEKIPILLGTQMVTKGLDFENVTLVGVLLADQSLYVNDFRAHERTFSIIAQVIGRSGRGEKTGRAVVQTFTPNHEVIQLASRQDYESFYEREIVAREVIECPPIKDLLMINLSGLDETRVLSGSVKIRNTIEGYFFGKKDIAVLGPAPAPIQKINNRHRYRIIIKCENSRENRDIIAHTIKEFSRDSKNRGVVAFADVDPYD